MEVMLLGRISSCAPSLEAQVILSLIYPRQDNLLLQLLFQIIGQEILSRSDSMEYEVGFWTRSIDYQDGALNICDAIYTLEIDIND